MNIKLILLIIILVLSSLRTGVVNFITLRREEPEKEYLMDENSLYYEEVNGKPVHVMMTDSGAIRVDTLPLNIRNYFAICDMYDISDPEKVYAQSCLESGHFTSTRFKTKNNHLGIKAGKNYAEYDNWTQCLKAYADKVQYKKKSGEDHYVFLARIGYAEDTEYINKVKAVVRSNRKRHKTFFESLQ